MPLPNQCPANYDPVCACDLETTYPNECAAHSANPPQNVAQEGQCVTDEPTFSPTTTKPSPQPITPAPITSEPIETPAPVTPAPITPVPVETPAPTRLPTPQVRNPFKLYDNLLDIV